MKNKQANTGELPGLSNLKVINAQRQTGRGKTGFLTCTWPESKHAKAEIKEQNTTRFDSIAISRIHPWLLPRDVYWW